MILTQRGWRFHLRCHGWCRIYSGLFSKQVGLYRRAIMYGDKGKQKLLPGRYCSALESSRLWGRAWTCGRPWQVFDVTKTSFVVEHVLITSLMESSDVFRVSNRTRKTAALSLTTPDDAGIHRRFFWLPRGFCACALYSISEMSLFLL